MIKHQIQFIVSLQEDGVSMKKVFSSHLEGLSCSPVKFNFYLDLPKLNDGVTILFEFTGNS